MTYLDDIVIYDAKEGTWQNIYNKIGEKKFEATGNRCVTAGHNKVIALVEDPWDN